MTIKDTVKRGMLNSAKNIGKAGSKFSALAQKGLVKAQNRLKTKSSPQKLTQSSSPSLASSSSSSVSESAVDLHQPKSLSKKSRLEEEVKNSPNFDLKSTERIGAKDLLDPEDLKTSKNNFISLMKSFSEMDDPKEMRRSVHKMTPNAMQFISDGLGKKDGDRATILNAIRSESEQKSQNIDQLSNILSSVMDLYKTRHIAPKQNTTPNTKPNTEQGVGRSNAAQSASSSETNIKATPIVKTDAENKADAKGISVAEKKISDAVNFGKDDLLKSIISDPKTTAEEIEKNAYNVALSQGLDRSTEVIRKQVGLRAEKDGDESWKELNKKINPPSHDNTSSAVTEKTNETPRVTPSTLPSTELSANPKKTAASALETPPLDEATKQRLEESRMRALEKRRNQPRPA